ncbi:RNA polymerase sigma factor [Cohnella terricola]|uniref:RNA polymerase sigma factor n=1 Tax=Cohnella terricola TaxID=1289167 RepID=A0A559JMV4_9BACL|nr:RNA polymerase sigma factor [Cohnella terricola]TVY01214.1 RNA polymerase sigma factor [Cohnella terricola]
MSNYADTLESADSVTAGSFERLQAALRKYCLTLAESAWDADDLVQDAWLKALDGSRFAQHPNPEAYLLRIAKNAWIDRRRRSGKLSQILNDTLPEADKPDHGLLGIEAAFRALAIHLPPLQRAIFLLREVLGYSSADAAALLSTTEGAVKAALHRARKSLPLVKEELETGGSSADDEPGLKAYLRTIAAAYQAGDITAMIELALRIESAPASAIGILHSGRLQTVSAQRRRGTSYGSLLSSFLVA